MTYLAQVIRPAPCCGDTRRMGAVFEVINTEICNMRCTGCFSDVPSNSTFVVTSEGLYMLASRVKRLPPPEEELVNLAVGEEVEA